MPSIVVSLGDEEFPPSIDSLTSLKRVSGSSIVTKDELELMNCLEWRSLKDIFQSKSYCLFNTIDIDDVKQGNIGNCYLLSVLSSLAKRPDRFKAIFHSVDLEKGEFKVRFFIQGYAKIVTIDDKFPVFRSGAFAFSQSGEGEVWVQVIEKAWAKVNGSYAATIGGTPAEALVALSEAPTITYITRKYEVDSIWKILTKADKKNFLVATISSEELELEEKGIIPSHAYTIVGVFAFKNLRLLKLRNPWGGFEWNGAFSDESSKWTEELKKAVNFKMAEDGEFFIELADFITIFPYIYVSKYRENYFFTQNKYLQHPKQSMIAVKIEVEEQSKIIFGLHQPPLRFNRTIENYSFHMGKLFLCRKVGTKYILLKSYAAKTEQIHLESGILEGGTYHLLFNVHWPYEEPCELTLTTYSKKEVTVTPLKREEVPNNYIEDIMENQSYDERALEDGRIALQSNLKDANTGFFFVRFVNKTALNLKLTVMFNHNENVRICSKYEVQQLDERKEINLLILPSSSHLLLFELADNPWKCNLQVKSVISEFFRTLNESRVETEIAANLNSMEQERLIPGVFYSEFVREDSVALVFNNLSEQNYLFRVILNEKENLAVTEEQKEIMLKVRKNRFCFIEIAKLVISAGVKVSFSYSFKKY